MTAYYNEIEPYPAQWLRNLVDAGHIAPGYVDNRSIKEVKPDDLTGYTQCHFFAGIAGWSYALRLAGWPDDLPVWTGSCPCQPFSDAGKRGGTDDPRHLWPDWFRLIRECRPSVIFGEQVASKDGLAWLDLVCSDLEGAGYAVAPFDLCAAGAGAPHLRQRLYFVAHTDDGRREQRHQGQRAIPVTNQDVTTGGLAHPQRNGGRINEQRRGQERRTIDRRPGFWDDVTWLPCSDGKYRPTQPGIFPLAHGAAARVGRLRAYGNAIVPELAAEFIRAYMETNLLDN